MRNFHLYDMNGKRPLPINENVKYKMGIEEWENNETHQWIVT